MLGSFGMVSPIGLGLALAQENEVIVLDGDASILTNPNILGTITMLQGKCQNLTILLLDNGTCGSTGNQETLALRYIDLETLAKAFGIKSTQKAYSRVDIAHSLEKEVLGPRLIHIIINAGQKAEIKNVPYTTEEIKNRFMQYLRRL
jgi:sulfopyruvate decarboxylase subunit beta